MTKSILLIAVGSAGDVFPMIGLGKGLKTRGHEVTVVCVPIFEEEVRNEGLGFIPLGTMDDIQAALGDPDLWHPIRGFEVIARLATRMALPAVYEILKNFDPAETLVLGSSFAFGARVAQEARGMPLITVHLQSSILMSADNPAEMGGFRMPKWVPVGLRRAYMRMIEAGVIDRMIAPGLNEFRAALDLPPAQRIFSGWMNSPDAVLGLFPDWFSPKQPDWPPNMTLTGFIKHESGDQQLPHAVKAFLEMGAAPLVFTAGSANVHGDEYFRTAAEAVTRLRERAIFLTRFPEQLPDPLPEGTMHALWVPMSALLPSARMLVHHGGIGTTAQALKAGIPQLVTPLAHDQFDNANRLVELGIGARVNPKRFTVNRAVEVLGIMLGNTEMAAEAGRYAGKVDFEGALLETCEFVERHL